MVLKLIPRMLALLAAALFSLAASAQETYPSKPIRMVVSFGGGAGELARILANKMSESLGQQVFVDLQPGAAGTIGASQVARAPADGYTILTGNNNAMIFRPLTMKRPPYNPVRDFTPISQFTVPALVLAVDPKLGVKTMAEFVAHTTRHPRQTFIGVFGSPSIGSMSVLMLRDAVRGLAVDSVAYKDEGQAIVDTLGGQVAGVIATSSSLQGATREGKLIPLAVFADERRPGYENVPTVAELVPGFEPLRPFTGVWGPPGLPRSIVDRLNKAVVDALNDPATRERILSMGSVVKPSSPAGLAKSLEGEMHLMSRALKRAGVEPE